VPVVIARILHLGQSGRGGRSRRHQQCFEPAQTAAASIDKIVVDRGSPIMPDDGLSALSGQPSWLGWMRSLRVMVVQVGRQVVSNNQVSADGRFEHVAREVGPQCKRRFSQQAFELVGRVVHHCWTTQF
jgi:hypothetical protein